MAVPKRKTTPSRRGMRRAHDFIKPINVGFDPSTGEAKLSHHISLADGFYKGKKVMKIRNRNKSSSTAEEAKA